ncbi:hypothetical protein, partial [Alistipes sp. ZOR0009]|uniref:hypothetical protein n=1 Tax=Alistipes sp. ZOR0009 TaxID=1339253 RepID=UPI001E4DE262
AQLGKSILLAAFFGRPITSGSGLTARGLRPFFGILLLKGRKPLPFSANWEGALSCFTKEV